MKIYPLQSQMITFKNNPTTNSGMNGGTEETAVIAGGAGGATIATGISRLNNVAKTAGEGAGKLSHTANIFPKDARNISHGIFGCFERFAGRLPKGLSPLGRILTSTPVRKVAGFAGGAIAFATAIFGLAETGATFGQLATENS